MSRKPLIPQGASHHKHDSVIAEEVRKPGRWQRWQRWQRWLITTGKDVVLSIDGLKELDL